MKHWKSVEMRKMINNATDATVFYNNNAAPIMRGHKISEKAKETSVKELFSKCCLSFFTMDP